MVGPERNILLWKSKPCCSTFPRGKPCSSGQTFPRNDVSSSCSLKTFLSPLTSGQAAPQPLCPPSSYFCISSKVAKVLRSELLKLEPPSVCSVRNWLMANVCFSKLGLSATLAIQRFRPDPIQFKKEKTHLPGDTDRDRGLVIR